MATRSMTRPHVWDKKNKGFASWLHETKAWKCATTNVADLKDVHDLQLALHMPEGSKIRQQVFDSLETEEMAGEDGWKAVLKILESHYQKDDNSTAFETWKEFRTLTQKENQSIDDYIMYYEKYKLSMKRYETDLGEDSWIESDVWSKPCLMMNCKLQCVKWKMNDLQRCITKQSDH